MNGYTKLFKSLVTSSIWQEDDETRIVWITMLALADRDGKVDASIPGLANIAKVSIEKTEASLAKLLAPDQYSRTKDYEGRRIEPVDGGWRILNHAKYREKLSDPDRREYQRIKQAQYRMERRIKNGKPLPGEAEAVKAMKRGHHKTADAIAGERR